MKNLKRIVLAVMAIALLAGCSLKENVSLKINNDKKVEFGYKILMDNELIDSILSMSESNLSVDGETGDKKVYTDEERWKYLESESCDDENSDYKCEKVEEGEFKGYFIKVNYDSIDDITGTGDKVNILELDDIEKPVFFTKDGDTYKSNFEYNMSEENQISSYSEQMDLISITFDVKLPNKSISNNATSVSADGLTLSWDLSKETSKSIDFAFNFEKTNTNNTTGNQNNNLISNNTNSDDSLISPKSSNSSKYILIAIIGGVVLLVLCILIVIFASSSSKKKNLNVETEASKMFATPMGTQNTSNNVPIQETTGNTEQVVKQNETSQEAPSETSQNDNNEKQN